MPVAQLGRAFHLKNQLPVVQRKRDMHNLRQESAGDVAARYVDRSQLAERAKEHRALALGFGVTRKCVQGAGRLARRSTDKPGRSVATRTWIGNGEKSAMFPGGWKAGERTSPKRSKNERISSGRQPSGRSETMTVKSAAVSVESDCEFRMRERISDILPRSQ